MIEIQAMFPVMVTAHLAELKEFYTSLFGFNVAFFEPGFYLHLVSPETGIQLGFLQPGHPSQPQFLHALMQPEGYVLSFEVADAAKAYAQAQSSDLNIKMALKEEVWGQIHFMLADPAGVIIDIVEHVSNPAE